MQFPLGFSDLSFWLAVTSAILIITAEFISPRYGQTNLLINKARLRTAALILGMLFLLTAFVQIFEIMISS